MPISAMSQSLPRTVLVSDRTIVKAHGGKLSIDNNDHGGATVVLSFLSTHATLVRA
jgi:K+-sensing histidine kinase KdpD